MKAAEEVRKRGKTDAEERILSAVYENNELN